MGVRDTAMAYQNLLGDVVFTLITLDWVQKHVGENTSSQSQLLQWKLISDLR